MSFKRRVVFDTNALISATILPSSISGQAFTLALLHTDIITSQATWLEYISRIQKPALQRYFPSPAIRDHAVGVINRAMHHITVQSSVSDCRDPDDNKFLSLALDGEASVIVTGDQDLLSLHPWRGIEIMTTGDFVRGFEFS